LRQDLLKNGRFALAKPLFAFDFKDDGDLYAATLFDLMVKVNKRFL
jgi:hypothetical protein